MVLACYAGADADSAAAASIYRSSMVSVGAILGNVADPQGHRPAASFS